MTKFTSTQALSEIRAYARNLGMTFKRQNATINGQAAYMLIKRRSGEVLAKNFTIWTAYDSMLSGYFDKVAQDAQAKNDAADAVLKANDAKASVEGAVTVTNDAKAEAGKTKEEAIKAATANAATANAVNKAMRRLHRLERMYQAGYPLSKECIQYSYLQYEFVAKKFIDNFGQETFCQLYDLIQQVYPY